MTKQRPKIVCLCGSIKFKDVFDKINELETLKGNIVLTPGTQQLTVLSPEQTLTIEELHKAKIDLADEVIIINMFNHIGPFTKSEIEYAKEQNKPIRYLVTEWPPKERT